MFSYDAISLITAFEIFYIFHFLGPFFLEFGLAKFLFRLTNEIRFNRGVAYGPIVPIFQDNHFDVAQDFGAFHILDETSSAIDGSFHDFVREFSLESVKLEHRQLDVRLEEKTVPFGVFVHQILGKSREEKKHVFLKSFSALCTGVCNFFQWNF